MKKILSLALLLLVALFSNAQTFDAAIGNELKFKIPQRQLIPLGNGFLGLQVALDQSPFVYSLHKKKVVRFGITLSKWTSSMTQKKESLLFNGERSCGPFLPALLQFYGQPWLLYYQFLSDDEDSKLQIMLAKIDTATLQPGQPKELFLLDQKNLGPFRSLDARNTQPLGITASPDSSKILLFWASHADNDLFIEVLDRYLDPLWSKEQKIWSDGVPALQSVCVNNHGSVFFTYIPGGNMDHPECRFGIRDPDGTSADREFRLEKGRPVSFFLLNTKDGDFVKITGTWSDKPGYTSGVYDARIDAAGGKISQMRLTPFPADLIGKLQQDHWAQTKPKKYGLEPIDLQAFLLDDGSIGLVGEFRRPDQPGPHGETIFLDGDFLYAHLPADTAGAAVFRVFPDYRRDEENSIRERFFALPWNNRILVFYPYNWAHTQPGLIHGSSNYYNIDLMAAAISDTGEIKTETLVSYGRDHYLAILASIQTLSPSALLVLLQEIRDPDRLGDGFEWCRITIR